MNTQKRKVRGYKICDIPYEKARIRAKGRLATLIESWVTLYGKGESFFVNPIIKISSKIKSSNNKK